MHRVRSRTLMLVPLLASALVASALMALHAPPAQAEEVLSPAPIEITGTVTPISTGPGNQNDPHISGTLVSYTNTYASSPDFYSRTHYHDLATAVDAAIPDDGHLDARSDVSGTTVVFRRVYTDGSPARPILAFDTADPAAGTIVLGPDAEARTSAPSIGGSTVAWEHFPGVSSSESEIVVHTLGGATTPLTSFGVNSRDPDVSPDGDVVAWATCATAGLDCDIFAARKNADDTWAPATRLTGAGSDEFHPATNGAVVVYASDAAGDIDIWWENVDGINENRLAMAGIEFHPAVRGSLIVFVHQDPDTDDTDLFAYDIATDALYQLTNTPTVRELLPDVAVDADGVAHVVWAQADGLELGHNDVYSMTFQVPRAATYQVCPQFDQTRSYRVGSTVPVRVQLCDEAGQNLSSAEIVLTATGLVKLDGTASSRLAEDAGNANPDSNFRYDGSSGQYIFNLSTKNLSAGTWQLNFTATGDPTTHTVTFDLR